MTRENTRGQGLASGARRIYELAVSLLSGPLSEEFVKAHPVVARTIQIRGDQTLKDLHEAIFDAFDRWDSHMYEFQVGGTGPMDPQARRYVLVMDREPVERPPAGDVARTPLDAVGLQEGEAFGYWFDFGDGIRSRSPLSMAAPAGAHTPASRPGSATARPNTWTRTRKTSKRMTRREALTEPVPWERSWKITQTSWPATDGCARPVAH